MKKTAILFAQGFEEVEALTVVDLLRRAKIGCDIISLAGSDCVTGAHGIRIGADRSFSETDFSPYDAVILPGGMPGTTNLAADERVLALLRSFAAAGKLTGAICAAPTVLAKAGLLQGRKACCYPGMEDQLTGAVACTVFFSGCDFRCPFCQNGVLVVAPGEQPDYSQEELLAFLRKRKGILDGVCISGGEPTLSDGLEEFLEKIKELGYAIKLDTNGSFPQRLRALIDNGLVDYVAMDIKNSKEKYAVTAGTDRFIPEIEQSVSILLDGKIDFEFRTTVVDELHEPEDFRSIGQWIQGADRYFLQGYVDSGEILAPGLHAASKDKMEHCLAVAREYIPTTQIRGL